MLFTPSNWDLLFYTNIDWPHCKFSNPFNPVPFSPFKFNCFSFSRRTYHISFPAFDIRKYDIGISSTGNFYTSANFKLSSCFVYYNTLNISLSFYFCSYKKESGTSSAHSLTHLPYLWYGSPQRIQVRFII